MGGMVNSKMAVSYTHLDVYKRQILLLADDGKNDQIVKAASDVHLLESLYQEYGL